MTTNPLLNKDIRAKEIQSCRILISDKLEDRD
jgi:hypothetical protein